MSWGRVATWCRERVWEARVRSSQLRGVVTLGVIILVLQLVRWLVA